MKKIFSASLFLVFVFLTQNVYAQCGDARYTIKIIDSTKTAVFTNTTTYPYHTFNWTFGDGQTSTAKSPTHKYSNSGLYWVELKGIDTVKKCYDTTGKWISIGCKSDFNVTSDGKKLTYSTSKPGALKLRFDFGNGTSSASSNGNHTYTNFGTYNVCLTVYCTVTDSAKTCQSVIIKSNCVAAFDIPEKDSVGKTKFTFVNRSTYSSGMKYYWDLGDGGSSTSINVYERIYAIGIYNICLRITDTSKKCSDSVCHTLNVGKHCDSGFSYTSRADTLSYSYTGNAANVKINFGDGKISTSKTGKHIYGKLGTFNVCLTAYCSSKDSSKLCRNVNMVKIPCNARFTKSIDTTQKFKIFLINNSTNTTTTTYQWDFGDGGSSTSRNPTHKYSTFGKFRVCLTVKDSSCSSTFCDTIGMDSTGKLLKAGTFEVVVIEQTGLISDKKIKTDFTIYPNPADSKVTIDLSNSLVQYDKLEIIDAIGQVCLKHSIENGNTIFELNLGMITPGLYFIKLSNNQKSSYTKMYKN